MKYTLILWLFLASGQAVEIPLTEHKTVAECRAAVPQNFWRDFASAVEKIEREFARVEKVQAECRKGPES